MNDALVDEPSRRAPTEVFQREPRNVERLAVFAGRTTRNAAISGCSCLGNSGSLMAGSGCPNVPILGPGEERASDSRGLHSRPPSPEVRALFPESHCRPLTAGHNGAPSCAMVGPVIDALARDYADQIVFWGSWTWIITRALPTARTSSPYPPCGSYKRTASQGPRQAHHPGTPRRRL